MLTGKPPPLLVTRKFWGLFVAQNFGAFADNALRNAAIIAIYTAATGAVITSDFQMPGELGQYANIFVSIGFTAPIFLFSMIAGQIADRFPRHVAARRLKLLELVLMMLASACFALGEAIPLVLALALMGSQTAFFQPVRFALMPQYFPPEQLARANGIMQGGTFIAIVTGLGIGAAFVNRDGGRLIISVLLISAAMIGFLASTLLPKAPAPGDDRINWNIPAVAWQYVREASRVPGVLVPILGNGYFWMVGAFVLALMTPFILTTLGGTEAEFGLLNAFFALGAGIGSIIAGIVAPKLKEPKTLSAVSLLITVVALIAIWALTGLQPIENFKLFGPSGYPLLALLVIAAAANGAFTVPLLASFQASAPQSIRARVMGVSNMTNGLFATIGALLIFPLAEMGLTPPQMFLVLAAMQLVVFGIMCWRYLMFRGRAANQTA
ncbi:MAG: MFS transporter [Pseudomonadota bacterium]